METPSRRVTRSQTAANSNNNNIPISKKVEESGKKDATKSRQRGGKKKQQQDRSALIDITNDSPIVGLAKGGLETPSSAMSKRKENGKSKYDGTPGSGEALLRGQVKTLLQKVEEEAELFSKVNSFEETRPFLFQLQGVVHSPMGLLLAPTPANTPQVLNLSSPDGFEFDSVSPSPVEDKLVISQMVIDHTFQGKKQEEEGLQSEKDLVTRSLLFEFLEKSEIEESKDERISNDEEDDELCEEFNNMSMKNGDDDDDDEVVGAAISPGALRLKGLPTPKGRHIRFHEEESDEE